MHISQWLLLTYTWRKIWLKFLISIKLEFENFKIQKFIIKILKFITCKSWQKLLIEATSIYWFNNFYQLGVFSFYFLIIFKHGCCWWWHVSISKISYKRTNSLDYEQLQVATSDYKRLKARSKVTTNDYKWLSVTTSQNTVRIEVTTSQSRSH